MPFVMKLSGAQPALRIANHRCLDCEWTIWEVKKTVEEQNANEAQTCPDCGGTHTEEYVGTMAPPKVIVRGNHDFAERENKRLYDRSNEQFKREGRDEAIERQRMQFKREGMVQ